MRRRLVGSDEAVGVVEALGAAQEGCGCEQCDADLGQVQVDLGEGHGDEQDNHAVGVVAKARPVVVVGRDDQSYAGFAVADEHAGGDGPGHHGAEGRRRG
jgi:hypothetical protein